METGYRGTFVISCNQTEADGQKPADQEMLVQGASWRWSGDAVRVDGPDDLVSLGQAKGVADLRKRAARSVRRLLGEALELGEELTGQEESATPDSQDPSAERGFSVTDGRSVWRLTLIETPVGSASLLMSVDGIPPRDRDLWIVEDCLHRTTISYDSTVSGSVICFTPGTMIRTPGGTKPVELLRQGDLVQTRDSGAQTVRWVGSRRMSGARLYLMPHLRPVRIRTDALAEGEPDRPLLVSPDHRMLIRGAQARALFGENELLVAARDLVNDQSITMDYTLRDVTYVHLLLDDHHVIWANGLATETFHPATAAGEGSRDWLFGLASDQRQALLEYFPSLAENPWAYGDFARRNLNASEAAILKHDLQRGNQRHNQVLLSA